MVCRRLKFTPRPTLMWATSSPNSNKLLLLGILPQPALALHSAQLLIPPLHK